MVKPLPALTQNSQQQDDDIPTQHPNSYDSFMDGDDLPDWQAVFVERRRKKAAVEQAKKVEDDPRGFQPFLAELPPGYCPGCRCRTELCHEDLFGTYVELRVAEYININIKYLDVMQKEDIEDMLYLAYNEVLRVKIVEVTNKLDTCTRYVPPMCMQIKSLKNSLNVFKYRKYMYIQQQKLENGEELGHVMECDGIIQERTF